jgi:5-methylcytosine-specific restriction enzyme subunit McrC
LLLEALLSHFLQEVTTLVHRGIRSDYVRIQAEKTFIKGRLRIAQQIRQPLSKQHHFQIEYDCFLPNRPENRLIKASLQWVVKAAKAPDNQRLACELLLSFDNVPHSSRIKIDLKQWSTQRDMIYYRAVKSWVELILLRETPWFLAGNWQGISLLFPMEKLFESYVEILLRRNLPIGYQLCGQQRFRSLVTHNEKSLFQLKPDLILYEQGRLTTVLDTKWKQLDWQAKNYNLSQSDFYQLFAYGHKYLGGSGNLVLIYPKTDTTPDNLQPFYFDEQRQLVLWVATFCLETDALHILAGAVGLDTIGAKN